MLADRGAVVIDADRIAREVVAPGSEALGEIVAAFGPEVLQADGSLDRARLGEVVFRDPAKRKQLESITHPRIMATFAKQIAQAAESNAEVVILDVPLLYETGNLVGAVEKIIVVYAPAAVQAQRVAARDGLAREQVQGRLQAQMDIEEKRKRADYVLDNTGDIAALHSQVDELWSRIAPA
jgi:dephospho-CoA kinase